MSIHGEAGYSTSVTGIGVFNNLVIYKQDIPENSLASIAPELGRPFTATDVKCTWDTLLGKTSPGFRLNPRKAWYHNLREVTTDVASIRLPFT